MMKPFRLLVFATGFALALSACGAEPETAAPASAAPATSSAFPVSITHTFGTTEIAKQPERVVTLGIGSEDALLALGVVPVAIPFATYGADEKGMRPWIKDKLQQLGAATPTILSNSEEPPYEEIVNARPDLILATYSGITKEQYDTLSKIAPTVGYPGEAWSTPWKDIVTTAGLAIGKKDDAQKVLDGIGTAVAEAAKAHPELTGKSVAFVWDSSGTFYVYTKADPRVEFGLDLGLTDAPAVSALDSDENLVTYTLSYEKLDSLESDILVNFATTQDEADTFLRADYAQAMSQVKRGTVASIVGAELISAVSPPTALSLTWGLDAYVSALSAAAKKAG
ncbi:iron-siderophore ABC transporter substrate-binding protein [Acrocarpospora macrocephala]|uniref:Periplasmic binding protein n=1 Tax=Acrocarpospora macrocephala TaxID=150177 RepID=A0A5M3WKZ5_9ACTN|nr:iron-siderophore ABC transporter substrate-binding protein [Acrocarpospora macrocephala]GES08829.1 periplasmic binding protein [Acrocarpospora macrocephala]